MDAEVVIVVGMRNAADGSYFLRETDGFLEGPVDAGDDPPPFVVEDGVKVPLREGFPLGGVPAGVIVLVAFPLPKLEAEEWLAGVPAGD